MGAARLFDGYSVFTDGPKIETVAIGNFLTKFREALRSDALGSTAQVSPKTKLPIEDFLFRLVCESGHLNIFHRDHTDILIVHHVQGRNCQQTNLEFNGITDVVITKRSKWMAAARLIDGYSVFTDGSKIQVLHSRLSDHID